MPIRSSHSCIRRASARLQGDFPGSPVVLRYRFGVAGGLISDLTISA
jgi:hypothetical protein